jgi:hypothetical protein
MNMNLSRPAERGFGMGVEKASAKPVMSKRRVLGDITNAAADDDSKAIAQNKKPSVLKPLAAFDIQMAESKEDDRSYMQRPVDDIDSRDIDNPLLVTDCVNEMYDHFRELERQFKVSSNYMSKQDFVNEKMRCILADWLVSA